MDEEFSNLSPQSQLDAAVVIAIHGYCSRNPRHHYVNEYAGWMVGHKGRPVAVGGRLERLIQFQSVSDANAWIRSHPLRQKSASYNIGFCVEDECGHGYMFESAAWPDVERLNAKVDEWNRRAAESAERLAEAQCEAEALRPALARIGVGPRTSNNIVRAHLLHLLGVEISLNLLLSAKELRFLEKAVGTLQASRLPAQNGR